MCCIVGSTRDLPDVKNKHKQIANLNFSFLSFSSSFSSSSPPPPPHPPPPPTTTCACRRREGLMNLLINRDLGLSTFNFMWKKRRADGLFSKSGLGVTHLYLRFLVTDSYIRASMTCTPCLRVDTAFIAELLEAGCITGLI